ncbi:MAG TPA: hypothetical protein VL361_21005 [Candidatus Limnocylindrales bacterium]|jgi:hypothetical protein|nr:hypothetical protein [Candidatus Limnocylindrales bacterium]
MNSIPSNVPPPIPAPLINAPGLALGEEPSEREPIPNAVAAAEAILRQPRRVMFQLRQGGSGGLIAAMFSVALLCAVLYGLVVGSFSMGTQIWAAPLKIAGGLLISALICLPSLYIFACLSGSQARFGEICGLVAGLLLLMTILLVGFAPVAWLFSQSTESVAWMGALHLVFWFIASCFGLRFLQAGFSHSQARSTAGLNTWVIIFMLVAVQMTTALRPLVGKSDTFFPQEKKLFLTHWGDCLKPLKTEPR